jgi:hypothetical protein
VLLPAIALGSIALIATTLRAGRPADSAGPVVPGLQVQAGASTALAPVSCEEGASPSLAVGNLLAPVSERRGVYLYDLDGAACFALSAGASFPAPRADRIAALAARAPVRLMPVTRLRLLQDGVEFSSLHTGWPAQPLLDAGLPADHRFLLVVMLADVADSDAAADAVDMVAALALAPEAPVGEPAITPTPAEQQPVDVPAATPADTLPLTEPAVPVEPETAPATAPDPEESPIQP